MDKEQIKMMREGSKADYTNAKAEYEEARRAAIEAGDNKTLDALNKLIDSSKNYSSANPMNNRSQRQYMTQLYRNATLLAQGKQDEVSPSGLKATPNIFNGYSSTENKNQADDVLYDFVKKNQNNFGGSSASQSGASATSNMPADGDIASFDWKRGLEWANEDTLEGRIAVYRDQLKENLADALRKKQAGYLVQTGRNVSIDNFQHYIDLLSSIDEKDPQALNKLSQVARLFDTTAKHWRSYFENYLPGEDKTTKAINSLKKSGYELVDGGTYGDAIQKIIDENGYKVAKKGNKTYLINSDYSGPVADSAKIFMNTDWRDPDKEGFGYIISDDGSFIEGNLSDYYNDSQSQYYNRLRQFVADQNNGQRAIWKTFNRLTDLSKYDIINNNAIALHDRSVADMSGYFDTDTPIIATIEGDDWNTAKSRYGHTKLDDSRITYYWGNKKGTYQELLRDLQINPNLNKQDGNKGYTNWQSAGVSLNGLNPKTEGFWTKDINRYNQVGNFFSNDHYNAVNKNLWTKDDIKSDQDIVKNSQGVARLLTQLFATDDNQLTEQQRKIKRRWWDEYSMDAIYLISDQLRKNPSLFAGDHYLDYMKAWHAILKAYRNKLPAAASVDQDVAVKKDGGILKAAEGTYIDLQGNSYQNPEKIGKYASEVREKSSKYSSELNKLNERASENGRSTSQQREIERDKWTSSDTLRCTALATDVAGLIAAVASPATSGVGSLVAIGSGFASMAQDAVADFTDDKVSTGQAWKNVGINTGLALGAAFGAKGPKLVASAAKLLPRAMMAIGAAGIVLDPEVHKTTEKIAQGKSLNVNDWKNLIVVLRTAAGIGTVGTMSYKARKANTQYLADYKKNLKKGLESVNSQLDPDIKYVSGANEGDAPIAIHKDIYAEVNKKLKTGKEEDLNAAMELLTKPKAADGAPVLDGGAGLSSAQAESIINKVPIKQSAWKKLRGKFSSEEAPTTKSLRDASLAQLDKAIGTEDIRAAARLKTISDIRGGKPANAFVDRYNPYLNAALGEARASGKNYRSIRELVSKETEVAPAYDIYNPAMQDPTAADTLAFRRAAAGESRAAATATATAEGLSGKQSTYDALRQRNSKWLKSKDAKIKTAEQDKTTYQNEIEAIQSRMEEQLKTLGEYNKSHRDVQSFLSEKIDFNGKKVSRREVLKQLQNSKTRNDAAFDALRTNDKTLLASIDPELAKLLDVDKKTGRSYLDLNNEIAARKKSADANFAALDDSVKAKFTTTSKTGKVSLKKGVAAPKTATSKEGQAYKVIQEKIAADKEKFFNDSAYAKMINLSAENKAISAQHRSINSQYKTLADKAAKTASARKDLGIKYSKNQKALADQKNKLQTVEQNLQKLIDSREKELSRRKTASKVLQESKNKVQDAANAKWRSKLAENKHELPPTRVNKTVKVNGSDVVVPAGTKINSYTHLRPADKVKVTTELKNSNPNLKEVPKESVKNILDSGTYSRITKAAVDTTTGQVVVMRKGGDINNKYSHLRH